MRKLRLGEGDLPATTAWAPPAGPLPGLGGTGRRAGAGCLGAAPTVGMRHPVCRSPGLRVTVLPTLSPAVILCRVAAAGVREAAALGPHGAPDGRQALHRVPALGE